MASRENERKRREWAERLVRSRAGGLTVARFVASGWILSRSVFQRIVTQVVLVVTPLVAYMKRLVQQDHAVGIDDTSCRLLLPRCQRPTSQSRSPVNPPQSLRLEPTPAGESGARRRRSPKTDLSVFANLECGARRRRFGPFPAAMNVRRANPRPQLIRPDPFASSQRPRVKAAPVGAAVQKPTWAYSPIWSAAPAGAALARSPQRSTRAEPIPVPN
jgi:hypothetical protein